MQIQRTTEAVNIISGVQVKVIIDQPSHTITEVHISPLMGNGPVKILDIDFFMEQFTNTIEQAKSLANEGKKEH
jgi:hypothetical protein